MISTKDITTGGTGGGLPKTLQPGNRVIKVNSIYLDSVPWDKDQYNLVLDCVSAPLGDTFEGFFIDKDNESLGRHKGQVGRVRSQEWAYADKTIGELEFSRDLEITKFLKNFAIATGCLDWYEAEDGKHKTIESLVKEMNDKAPFAEKLLNACLCGKEYENKAGYTNHDLFFPKFSKAGLPFESNDTVEGASRVYTFNDKEHIRVKKVKEVDGFVAPTAKSGSDFEL